MQYLIVGSGFWGRPLPSALPPFSSSLSPSSTGATISAATAIPRWMRKRASNVIATVHISSILRCRRCGSISIVSVSSPAISTKCSLPTRARFIPCPLTSAPSMLFTAKTSDLPRQRHFWKQKSPATL